MKLQGKLGIGFVDCLSFVEPRGVCRLWSLGTKTPIAGITEGVKDLPRGCS